jgi:hypothetical protein
LRRLEAAVDVQSATPLRELLPPAEFPLRERGMLPGRLRRLRDSSLWFSEAYGTPRPVTNREEPRQG